MKVLCNNTDTGVISEEIISDIINIGIIRIPLVDGISKSEYSWGIINDIGHLIMTDSFIPNPGSKMERTKEVYVSSISELEETEKLDRIISCFKEAELAAKIYAANNPV